MYILAEIKFYYPGWYTVWGDKTEEAVTLRVGTQLIGRQISSGLKTTREDIFKMERFPSFLNVADPVYIPRKHINIINKFEYVEDLIKAVGNNNNLLQNTI